MPALTEVAAAAREMGETLCGRGSLPADRLVDGLAIGHCRPPVGDFRGAPLLSTGGMAKESVFQDLKIRLLS